MQKMWRKDYKSQRVQDIRRTELTKSTKQGPQWLKAIAAAIMEPA